MTGGGSGIGRASALTFLREGALVVIGDLNEASLAETVALARAQGGGDRLASLRADVSAERDVAALVAVGVERFGGRSWHGRLDNHLPNRRRSDRTTDH